MLAVGEVFPTAGTRASIKGLLISEDFLSIHGNWRENGSEDKKIFVGKGGKDERRVACKRGKLGAIIGTWQKREAGKKGKRGDESLREPKVEAFPKGRW